MNRNEFLKKLGITGTLAVATPMLLSDNIKVVNPPKGRIAIDINSLQGMTNNGQKLTPRDILEIFHNTGILIYNSKCGNCPAMLYGEHEFIDMNKYDYDTVPL